jgi:hypothetical protein
MKPFPLKDMGRHVQAAGRNIWVTELGLWCHSIRLCLRRIAASFGLETPCRRWNRHGNRGGCVDARPTLRLSRLNPQGDFL